MLEESKSKKIASKVLEKVRARMNEEAETLDELSKGTLGSYVKKATNQVFSKGIAGGAGLARGKEDEAQGMKNVSKAAKRMQGVNVAASKLSGHGYTKVAANEEAENLDELSKGTLASYASKAKNQLSRDSARAGYERGIRTMDGKGQGEMEKAYDKRADKRYKGIDTALDKLAKEEVEELDEISQMMARAARDKAGEEIAGHRKAIEKEWNKNKPNYGKISDIQQQWERRKRLSDKVTRKLAKEEADMLDTALSDVKQSSRGEVYKKTTEKTTAPTKPTGTKTGVTGGKTGEAYNTTPLTKRFEAVEYSVRAIMERSHQIKRMHAEAATFDIGSPEQREDWMNVERGQMNVVDYFNKYKVTGEE